LGFWAIVGGTIMTDVPDTPSYQNFLFQNSPNPFNPSTSIRFNLQNEEQTRIEIYDLKGRRVAVLLDETVAAGEHSVVFRPENLASGVYLLTLQAGSFRASSRLLLLK